MGQSKRNNNRVKKIKGEYSKFIVSTVILLNIIFTIAVFVVFVRVGNEPATLIGAWFSFTTVELWQLARIKHKKIEKEIHEVKANKSFDDNRMEEG